MPEALECDVQAWEERVAAYLEEALPAYAEYLRHAAIEMEAPPLTRPGAWPRNQLADCVIRQFDRISEIQVKAAA